MMVRSTAARIVYTLVVATVALVALVGGASAKGTPSNITVTCDANALAATVTVQLMSSVANPTPASNQIALHCGSGAPVATAKIAPLTQPAGAYAWSAFVTATDGTFGCGGTTQRGTTAACTNDAGGSGKVTVLAS
jgi:hypothetical protein